MNQNEIFTRIVDQDKAVGLLIKTAAPRYVAPLAIGTIPLLLTLSHWAAGAIGGAIERKSPEYTTGEQRMEELAAQERATNSANAEKAGRVDELEAENKRLKEDNAYLSDLSPEEANAERYKRYEEKRKAGKLTLNDWLSNENNLWSLGAGAAGAAGTYGLLGLVPGLNQRKNRIMRALLAAAGGLGIGYATNQWLGPAAAKATDKTTAAATDTSKTEPTAAQSTASATA